MIKVSGKFTPAALTPITIWPLPAFSAGRSSRTRLSGGPYCLQRIAFMCVRQGSLIRWFDLAIPPVRDYLKANERAGEVADHRWVGHSRHRRLALERYGERLARTIARRYPLFQRQHQFAFSNCDLPGIESLIDCHPLAVPK